MKKMIEVIEALRKDNLNKLWDKLLKDYTDADWIVIENLINNNDEIIKSKTKKGKSKSKKVYRISDGQIYENGKQCYEMNNISKAVFYNLISGRKPDCFCNFKYI